MAGVDLLSIFCCTNTDLVEELYNRIVYDRNSILYKNIYKNTIEDLIKERFIYTQEQYNRYLENILEDFAS